MNSVVEVGRLTKDPELRYIQGTGTPVATFTIAVDRDFKKEGQPEADFFNIVVWQKQGENCAKHLLKGQMVAIRGRLQNRKYQNQQGENRYITEIVAERVQFLSKPGGHGAPQGDIPEGFYPMGDGGDDDDLPF